MPAFCRRSGDLLTAVNNPDSPCLVVILQSNLMVALLIPTVLKAELQSVREDQQV